MQLPEVRGKYKFNYDISKTSWFAAGGKIAVLFTPTDIEDLQFFLKSVDKSMPLFVLGNTSNLLVRDGGFNGVFIKLGKFFSNITLQDNIITAGCASPDSSVANFAQSKGLSGVEFLTTIPGSIGGAIAMNAGCYGKETKDVLKAAIAMDFDGNLLTITPNQNISFSYRTCITSQPLIFLSASFACQPKSHNLILSHMDEMVNNRNQSQPIRVKTGGSTFKNPPEGSAWKFIKEADADKIIIGGASMSPKHANFLINNGNATATDIENLIKTIQTRVFEHSGIALIPEIKIIGNPL